MNILKMVIIAFIVLESTNVIAMYFFPGTKKANSVGVFKMWEKSKSDPAMHDFVKYLVNWVAGTKLIFIMLLIVILSMADEKTVLYAGGAMMISIASFFWRLFPLIRKMDNEEQIDPKNYSKVLALMISVLILVFLAATYLSL